MMEGQAKHVRSLIHNGVQMAWPNPKREESSAYDNCNIMKKQTDLCWTKRRFGLKFGVQKPKADGLVAQVHQ
jgi:hypothetical protein